MADLKLRILLDAVEKISAPFKRARQSTDDLKSALKSTTDNIRAMERQSARIEAFGRLKQDAQANATALQAAQEKAQRMGRELAEAGGGSKKAQSAFAAARREVNRLEAAQVSIARETATLRRQLSEGGIDTRNLATAQRQLKRDLDAARAAAQRQSSALDAMRARTEALGRARAKLQASQELQGRLAMNGAVGMGMGGGALAIGARMGMDGIGFDEQMSAVGAVSRLETTSQEFAKLRDLAKELGATTSFSASEAAQGLQYLAMAGFNAQQMLAAMPGVLDLAKAGATDLGQASDIASNILSGFGLQADEMGRVGDVLVATFTRSNVNLAMLGDTMKYTAPIARQFGASIEDVAAMSGLLGNVGIQGSEAGTALRALFTRMAAPPKAAADAMKKLGIQARDAQGNMRSMTEILTEVAQKTEKLGAGKRIDIFTDIAGMEAGSAMAELVSQQGADGIAKFTQILKGAGGEAARVARQMGDNAAGDIKGFQSAVEGMNIALTDTNTGALRELIQTATGAVRTVTAWVQENPRLAATLVKVAAAVAGLVFVGGALSLTIASVIGPLAMAKFALSTLAIQGGITSGVLGMMGTVGSGAMGMLSAGIRLVSAAFMANPIGLAIMAIITAVTALYAVWEPFRTLVDETFAAIAGIFGFGGDKTPLADTADKVKAAAPSPAPMKIAQTAAVAAAVAGPVAAPPPAAAVPVEGSSYTVNVYGAPGQSEAELARLVRLEIEKIERQKKRDAGAKLYDSGE